MTIGSGIGGGLVIDGQIHHGHGIAAAEIGHLRPGLHADRPDETVESLASGWGIAAAAQSRLADPIYHPFPSLREKDAAARPDELRRRIVEVEEVAEEFAADLLDRADGKLDQVTAKLVAQAASEGNQLALDVLNHACQVLGWAIAQVITLLSPDVVVIGGGVSQIGESLLLFLFAPKSSVTSSRRSCTLRNPPLATRRRSRRPRRASSSVRADLKQTTDCTDDTDRILNRKQRR